MGRKERGEGCCAPFAGGGRKELGTHLTECGLAPSNTTSPGRGLPLYQVLSLSTSHFATTDTGQKLGGSAPFWHRGAGSPSNTVARAEAYLHAKFHLDPSNHLAAVHQRHRQTGQTNRQTTVQQDRANRFTNGRPKTKARFSRLL